MAIVGTPQMFAILGQTNVDKIGQAIKEKYPTDNLPLASGQWIIVASGTAQELCGNLGITDGSTGNAVVVAFVSYYGRASAPIWEWLASRAGARLG